MSTRADDTELRVNVDSFYPDLISKNEEVVAELYSFEDFPTPMNMFTRGIQNNQKSIQAKDALIQEFCVELINMSLHPSEYNFKVSRASK
ncbi:Hypothetical predicted protein [Octopus vulgaris]|uniref:Uncharacterized protein n=1 Tax=Octopus vulgaris TaxID=6645 RepID=A0AA36BSX0_OCTVU|nr:Hypothetical predicted protein [Octopus vulgaris]